MAGSSFDSSDSGQEAPLMSSINITPFVDVVLVLLVIFIVTAPMLVKDVLELHLPKSSTGDGQVSETLGIAVNRDGNYLVNGKLTDDAGLTESARKSLGSDPMAQAIIAADREVPYGRVVHAIDLLKSSGLHRFAVQIEHEESQAPSASPGQ